MQAKRHHFVPERAPFQGLDEGTHNVVAETDISSVSVEQRADNGKGVLHPDRLVQS